MEAGRDNKELAKLLKVMLRRWEHKIIFFLYRIFLALNDGIFKYGI